MFDRMGVTRRGVWFAAGTSVYEDYPCRCPEFDAWSHSRGRCACWGRTDLAHLPWACCAWRYWRTAAAVVSLASARADH